MALGRNSQARWPAFADELKQASPASTWTCAARARWSSRSPPMTKPGCFIISNSKRSSICRCNGSRPAETRRREPQLGRQAGGRGVQPGRPSGRQSQARRRTSAIAAQAAGARVHEHQPVAAISSQGRRVDGVVLADGRKHAADNGGAGSRRLVARHRAQHRRYGAAIAAAGAPDQRPDAGPAHGPGRRHSSATSSGGRASIWCRAATGRLIIGATVEERGFDSTLTAGGLLTLLEAAWRAVPAIEELPIDEMWVGHRPGSRDDAPILGPAPLDGLIYATGHHRNGILLAPVTADTIARLVLDGTARSGHPAVRHRAVHACQGGGVGWPKMSGHMTNSDLTHADAQIRINGADEPLVAATLAALLEEKAVDVAQRGIAVALNGAVIPRAAWPQTGLQAGDTVEIVRARQGG